MLSSPDRIYPPRFMLMVTSIPEGKRDQIQAVCHEGGTGRLQTIRREWNPAYYDVVEKFGQATGVPVLLNTSYNLRGELYNYIDLHWNQAGNDLAAEAIGAYMAGD